MSLANFFASIVFESAENKDPDTHCMPWLVDPSDRCQYVKDQISVCGEGTGLVPYMRIHYCTFDFRYFQRFDSVFMCVILRECTIEL